jgi:bifunctional ADP-heptose synthase (sugar kinase/adenylyltransferase)
MSRGMTSCKTTLELTLTGEGLEPLLATPAASLSIPAVKTPAVDTIGAGDSYMSALILGLLTRGTGGLAPSVLDQLGRTAATAAAITVSRAGARPPTEDELRATLQLQPQLQLHSGHDPPGDCAERRQCGGFTPGKETLDSDLVTRVTSIT